MNGNARSARRAEARRAASPKRRDLNSNQPSTAILATGFRLLDRAKVAVRQIDGPD